MSDNKENKETKDNKDGDAISWNPALETLIAEEAERCAGFSWLHTQCEDYYARRANLIALPVIVLSTVNGFLSGSSQMIFSDPTTSSIGIGAVSLFTGVLSTIGSFFAWSRRTEAHKISAIQYKKISRFLTIELSLPRTERIQAKDILKITREQIERLLEISPSVPNSIQADYKRKFKECTDVAHPEIISGLHKVYINKTMPDEIEDSKVKITIVPGISSTSSKSK